MADLEGQQLGTYRLLQLLGSGGFADVYLGEHIYLKTKVAVKLLHSHIGSKEREKFIEEASLVASLSHPHIIRILHCDIQDKIPFLVMEYASKGSLRDRHPQGTQVPLSTVISYIKQIASALQYAHIEKKLVHRDISPDNLLVGLNDEILVSDFGLAVLTRSYLAQPLGFAGKFHYMAPEQIRGVPQRASDQYALGIIVYEWLSGDVPFDGSFEEIISKHLVVPPPPFNKALNIPSQVEQAVLKALKKNPDDRYPSVQVFSDALEQASMQAVKVVPKPAPQPIKPLIPQPQPKPIVPAKPIISPQPTKTARHSISRRKFFVGTGVAVGLALLGFGGYVIYSERQLSSNLELLYREDGSDNWNGWTGSSDWKVINGMLQNDGISTNGFTAPTIIVSPYKVSGTDDYAIEATIQVVSFPNTGYVPSFEIGIRGNGSTSNNDWQGYWAEVSEAQLSLASGYGPFQPGNNWHTYRLEAKGNSLKVFVDGTYIAGANSNEYPTGGQSGLGSLNTQLKVNSFKVFAI